MTGGRKIENGKTAMSKGQTEIWLRPYTRIIRAAMMKRVGHTRNDAIQGFIRRVDA